MPTRVPERHRATIALLSEIGGLWFVLAFAWVVGAVSLTFYADQLPTLGDQPRGENLAHGFLIVVISLTAASVLFRRHASGANDDRAARLPMLADDSETHRSSLALLWLRWLAIGSLMAVVHTAWARDHLSTTAFISVAVLLATASLVNALLTFNRHRLRGRRSLGLQLGFDIGLQGAIVHIAGGLASPLAGLFVILALLAGFLLPRRDGVRMVLSIGTFCFVLGVMELTVLAPLNANLIGNGPAPIEVLAWSATVSISVLIAGLTVSTLAERVRQGNLELAEAASSLAKEAAELSAAREELVAEQQKLDSIVGCMADAVVFADPNGRVQFHNKAAAGLWADRGGDADLRVCHTDAIWQKLLNKLKDPGENELHPLLIVGDRHFDASYARVSTPDGKLLGAVMVARDVTDRIRQQRHHMEEERAATIQRMAGSLAHELNNPLSAISLFTQHAQKQVENDSPLSLHLSTVRKNAELCTKIVRQLLNYTRPRSHERELVRIADLVDDAANTVTAHAAAAHVTLECDTSESSCTLSVVPDQLRQVLVNLALNAIDATPNGGTVALRTRQAHDSAASPGCVIEVADTGAGIPPETRAKIFEAFFTTKTNGTGLGLAVVHDIIRDHGGQIEVLGRTSSDGSATSGCGTTFRVCLPSSPSTPSLESTLGFAPPAESLS